MNKENKCKPKLKRSCFNIKYGVLIMGKNGSLINPSWLFLPQPLTFSPFISSSLTGNVENSVYDVLLSTIKVKTVTFVMASVCAFSESARPGQWSGWWLCVICGRGSAATWHNVTPCHGRRAEGHWHSVMCLLALCAPSGFDDVIIK